MNIIEFEKGIKFIDFVLNAIAVPKKNIQAIHFGKWRVL